VLVRGKLDRRRGAAPTAPSTWTTSRRWATSVSPPCWPWSSPRSRACTGCWRSSRPAEQHTAGVSYTLLRKVLRTPTAKPPFYKRVTIEVNDAEQEAYNVRLQGNVTDLARVQVRPGPRGRPPPGGLLPARLALRDLPVQAALRADAAHPPVAEDMLDDLYTETDPWARYMDDQTGDAEISGAPACHRVW
jgi:hypothetical protein